MRDGPVAGFPMSTALSSACPVCETKLSGAKLVNLGSSAIYRCGVCESAVYTPRNTRDAQEALHDSQDYHTHPYFKNRRKFEKALELRCEKTIEWLSKSVDVSKLKGERWLDVGCDTGLFMKCIENKLHMSVVGVDVSASAVAQARAGGLEVFHSSLEGAPSNVSALKFISAIDVIEHLAEPQSFFKEASLRLEPGGYCFIETPNIESSVYRLGAWISRFNGNETPAFLTRLFPREHIQYFSVKALKAMAQKHGFETVAADNRVLPMRDIGGSWALRLGLGLLQCLDRLDRTKPILLRVLFVKPAGSRS